MRDLTTTDAVTTFGSLGMSGEHRGRTLSVSVRVGDHALDNTNFLVLQMGFGRMGPGAWQLPLGSCTLRNPASIRSKSSLPASTSGSVKS